MFKKYEKFKQSLKSKNLSPKEYQKMVKNWMDQNDNENKKKNRRIRSGNAAYCGAFDIVGFYAEKNRLYQTRSSAYAERIHDHGTCGCKQYEA